jgi:hypothetical protein
MRFGILDLRLCANASRSGAKGASGPCRWPEAAFEHLLQGPHSGVDFALAKGAEAEQEPRRRARRKREARERRQLESGGMAGDGDGGIVGSLRQPSDYLQPGIGWLHPHQAAQVTARGLKQRVVAAQIQAPHAADMAAEVPLRHERRDLRLLKDRRMPAGDGARIYEHVD